MKEYIKVPFAEKDKVKELGARWDKEMKSWYIPEDADKDKFNQWEKHDPLLSLSDPTATRIYLNVPFADKDAVKAAGGRWDGDKKQWYYLSDKDGSAFSQWADSSSTSNNNVTNKTVKKVVAPVHNNLDDELDDILKLGDL